MKKTEGTVDPKSNLNEVDWIDLNNSQFNDMHLQWFAEEDPPADPPDPGDPPDPEETKLSGLFEGATAEQREKYGDYLKEFQKLPELIDAHMALKTKADGSIQKPGEKASEEELAAYKKSMGIPDTEDDYDFGELPEGQTQDKELDKWFRDLALKSNLNNDQAKMQYLAFNKLITDGNKAALDKKEADKQAVEKELKKDFGKDYPEAIAKANRFMKILNVSAILDSLGNTELENDPRFIKIFTSMGQIISEDSLSKITVPGNEPKKKSQAEILFG